MGQAVKDSRLKTTLGDHIRELQLRLVVCALVLIVAGVVVFQFYTPILTFLNAPLGEHLYYSSPAGGFTFIMKICAAVALIVTVPVIFYNVIMFIRPAFKSILSIKRVVFVTMTSTLLAISGAAFAYYCILPGSLIFFKGFRVGGLSALISADSYLSFLTSMIITFVIIFQIPLIMGFIDTIKPLSPKKLLKLEKYVVIGSLVIALLAPFTYDFVTSILIAIPIIVLYNLSILLVVFQHATKRKSKKPAVRSNEEKVVGIEEIIDEFYDEEGLVGYSQKTISVEEITEEPTVSGYGNTFMDFKPSVNRSYQPVTRNTWVRERETKRPNLSRGPRLISDFRL